MPTQKNKVAPLKGTASKPWSKAEEDFVKRNYKKLTDKEMAASLGRGLGGVTWKRNKLNLKKEPTYAELQHQSSDDSVDETITSPIVSPEADHGPTPQPSRKPWWRFW